MRPWDTGDGDDARNELGRVIADLKDRRPDVGADGVQEHRGSL